LVDASSDVSDDFLSVGKTKAGAPRVEGKIVEGRNPSNSNVLLSDDFGLIPRKALIAINSRIVGHPEPVGNW
jgi:hypothetical protein